MAAGEVDVYVDLVTGERLLMPGLHHPMKLGENGTMYQVKSKLTPMYWRSKLKSIDFVIRYALVPLAIIDCLAMFDAYMVEISLSEKDVESVKRKIYGDLGDLQTRFSDFKFYTGNQNHGCVTKGYPFPPGMLVVADTASQPPTFYYVARGMLGLTDPAIERFVLKRSGPNLPLYLPGDSEEEEEGEGEGDEEEGDEEVGECDEEGEGEESEVEEEGEEEDLYDLAEKIKGLPPDDDYFNSDRSRYAYHPSRGTSYWGGLVDNKQPKTSATREDAS